MAPIMKYITGFFVIFFLISSSTLKAQVQVCKEPMHKMVVENKYIRLLDVVVNPGDTTKFHVHSTPSLYIYYNNSNITTQVKGAKWAKEQTVEGKVLFRFFSPDSLVHRVANPDSIPLHMNDIELLSTFKKENEAPLKPLPFPLLFCDRKQIRRESHAFFRDVWRNHRCQACGQVHFCRHAWLPGSL